MNSVELEKVYNATEYRLSSVFPDAVDISNLELPVEEMIRFKHDEFTILKEVPSEHEKGNAAIPDFKNNSSMLATELPQTCTKIDTSVRFKSEPALNRIEGISEAEKNGSYLNG